jgi:hypothetical protein
MQENDFCNKVGILENEKMYRKKYIGFTAQDRP